MSKKRTDQECYVELYFDLERLYTDLHTIKSLVEKAQTHLTHIYEESPAEEAKEGETVQHKELKRPNIDIGTRASVSSNLNMILLQMQQIAFTIGYAQQACQVLAPSLQQSSDLPN